MNKGIVYTLWNNNKRIVREIEVNNKQAKKFKYETCLLYDPDKCDINTKQFDHTIEHSMSYNKFKNRCVWGDIAFPFDVCCFLDSDAYIVNNIDFGFEQARKHGIALSIAPASSLHYALPMKHKLRKVKKYQDLPQYNCGVVFANLPQMGIRDVFVLYGTLLQGYELGDSNDQPFFSIALYEYGINPYVLPNTWNLRQHITDGKIHGQVKIWHGKYPWPNLKNFPQQGLYYAL